MSTLTEAKPAADEAATVEMTYREAINAALDDSLASDPAVLLIGEDVDADGGVFKTNGGLVEKYGRERVRVTPIARIVSGTLYWPPDMNRNFGTSLTIASPAVGRKSANMISTTGRSPVTAIPSATPTKPFSQIGVFRTRSGPKRSTRPTLVLKTPPSFATSSPMKITLGSLASSSSSASRIPSR